MVSFHLSLNQFLVDKLHGDSMYLVKMYTCGSLYGWRVQKMLLGILVVFSVLPEKVPGPINGFILGTENRNLKSRIGSTLKTIVILQRDSDFLIALSVTGIILVWWWRFWTSSCYFKKNLQPTVYTLKSFQNTEFGWW